MKTPKEKLEELRNQRRTASVSQGLSQGVSESVTGGLLNIPNLVARIAERQTGTRLPRDSGVLGLLPDTGREGLASFKGGVKSLLGLAPDRGQAVADEVNRRNAVEEQQPTATAFGEHIGHGVNMGLSRAPFVKGPGGLFDAGIKRGIDSTVRSLGPRKTGVRAFARDIVDSDLFRDIAKGLGRSTEAGLEGMVMATVQEGDPVNTAAVSAGSQLGASLALEIADDAVNLPFKIAKEEFDLGSGKATTFKGKLGGLAVMGGVLGTLFGVYQNATPAENSPDQASDTAYGKLAAQIALGVLATSLGGGRPEENGMLSSLPVIADMVRSIPRGTIISMIENQTAQDALQIFQKTPEAISKQNREKIMQSIMDGTYGDTIDELYEKDEKFRELFTLPHPKLAGVPEK